MSDEQAPVPSQAIPSEDWTADIPIPAVMPFVDPEWIAEFHLQIKVLLAAARDMERCADMPHYRGDTLRLRWHPALERLQQHLYKVARFAETAPPNTLVVRPDDPVSGGLLEAFRMACGMVDAVMDIYKATGDPNTILVPPLERIDELLTSLADVRKKDPPPPPPQAATVRIGRLEIDPLTKRVSLDRKSEIIKHPIAFQIFLFIAKAEGAPVTSEEIRKEVLHGNVRIDTILKKHLPDWVRELIPGQPGRNGGYALRLPE
jgi:hypothetical protein